MEAKGDLVVDGHVDNEGNFWAGAGAHPWHLDEQTESTLFLTNMSDQTVRMGFRVDVSGSSYFLTKLSLGPHETRSIDIRKLRDAQKPDFKGNLIPAGASDGSVSWVHLQKIPVMGRLVVLRRKEGLASSYQCGACPCPSYAGLSMTPSPSYYLAANSSYGYAATAEYTTCTAPYYTDMTDSATWTSDNTPVATVSTGMVTAVAGGTANIKASYTGVTFVAEFSECEPTGQATYNPTCPTTVPSGTITINLGPPPSTRSSSFSAGDGLSFAGFVSCGNILGAVGCGSGWFWQVEVVGTVSDNAANWAVTQDTNTETTTITLTNLTQNTTVSGYSHDNPNPALVQTSNGTTKVYWLDSPGPLFNSNIYSINDQATKTSRICSTETSTTDCVCVDWNYQLVGTANLTGTAGIINTTSSSAAITRTSYICQTQR